MQGGREGEAHSARRPPGPGRVYLRLGLPGASLGGRQVRAVWGHKDRSVLAGCGWKSLSHSGVRGSPAVSPGLRFPGCEMLWQWLGQPRGSRLRRLGWHFHFPLSGPLSFALSGGKKPKDLGFL